MMKAFVLVGIGLVSLAGAADAGRLGGHLAPAPDPGSTVLVDWQDPTMLPRQFRNHCSTEAWSGRSYCSDHCGRGYQFYYCGAASFGCCRVGYGYCDHRGHLRCHP
jgi:hypothetical protein